MHKMPNYCVNDDSCSVFSLAGRRTREIYLRAQEASTIAPQQGVCPVLLCPPSVPPIPAAGDGTCSVANCSSDCTQDKESVDSPAPRTSANHATAETETREPDKTALARDRRRCESCPLAGRHMTHGVSGGCPGRLSRCDADANVSHLLCLPAPPA